MQKFATLNGICSTPLNVSPSEVLVVFHGYGASAQDLLPLAQPLAQFLPTASQVFLEAPEPYPDTSVVGGRAWFPLRELSLEEIVAGLRAVEGCVTEAIEAISTTYAMPFSRIALLGFSQGGTVALQATCAVRSHNIHHNFLASVGIATRFVENAREEETTNTPDMPKTPILMIHGDVDVVIPCAQGLHTAEMLRKQGYPLTWHERKGMGHEIDQKTLQLAGEFLAQHATKQKNDDKEKVE